MIERKENGSNSKSCSPYVSRMEQYADFSRFPQYPVSLHCQTRLSRLMRNCPFPRYQTQTPSRDKVPGCVFLIASAFSRDARLSGHFLSFSSWTVYVREERPLWQSRMDGCAKRLRSLVYVFPLGWLARVFAASHRAAHVSNPHFKGNRNAETVSIV